MLANLLLLPSLLLSLEKSIANKETLKKPSLGILPENMEDDEEVSEENKNTELL
jgi:hypothetical protein